MSHIYIDGYNLIRSSSLISSLGKMSTLEDERNALIDKLSSYKKFKNIPITVIFDGTKGGYLSVFEEKVRGIRVVYSKLDQTADELLIEKAKSEKEKAIVVSSDNEIIHKAKKYGCGVLSSGEFAKKVKEAFLYDLKGLNDSKNEVISSFRKTWTTKKKGPAKRLPKEKRKALAKIENL